MKLYGYYLSSSAWRVRLALELKGIGYQQESVNLQAKTPDGRSPEFSGASPLGQVPVLEVESPGGVKRLTQSLAIIEYLDETHPAPRLLPSDPFQRAFCRECSEIINAGIQPLQNLAVQHKLRELGADPKPFVVHFVRRGLEALARKLASFEGPFALGDRASLVDVCLIPQLYASRRFDVPLEALPRLLEIEDHCGKLEPFLRAHPDAQPDRPG